MHINELKWLLDLAGDLYCFQHPTSIPMLSGIPLLSVGGTFIFCDSPCVHVCGVAQYIEKRKKCLGSCPPAITSDKEGALSREYGKSRTGVCPGGLHERRIANFRPKYCYTLLENIRYILIRIISTRVSVQNQSLSHGYILYSVNWHLRLKARQGKAVDCACACVCECVCFYIYEQDFGARSWQHRRHENDSKHYIQERETHKPDIVRFEDSSPIFR